jgi:hypothetical protein
MTVIIFFSFAEIQGLRYGCGEERRHFVVAGDGERSQEFHGF